MEEEKKVLFNNLDRLERQLCNQDATELSIAWLRNKINKLTNLLSKSAVIIKDYRKENSDLLLQSEELKERLLRSTSQVEKAIQTEQLAPEIKEPEIVDWKTSPRDQLRLENEASAKTADLKLSPRPMANEINAIFSKNKMQSQFPFQKDFEHNCANQKLNNTPHLLGDSSLYEVLRSNKDSSQNPKSSLNRWNTPSNINRVSSSYQPMDEAGRKLRFQAPAPKQSELLHAAISARFNQAKAEASTNNFQRSNSARNAQNKEKLNSTAMHSTFNQIRPPLSTKGIDFQFNGSFFDKKSDIFKAAHAPIQSDVPFAHSSLRNEVGKTAVTKLSGLSHEDAKSSLRQFHVALSKNELPSQPSKFIYKEADKNRPNQPIKFTLNEMPDFMQPKLKTEKQDSFRTFAKKMSNS